jgi:hypothetical protein
MELKLTSNGTLGKGKLFSDRRWGRDFIKTYYSDMILPY